jgi:hypothetical protein
MADILLCFVCVSVCMIMGECAHGRHFTMFCVCVSVCMIMGECAHGRHFTVFCVCVHDYGRMCTWQTFYYVLCVCVSVYMIMGDWWNDTDRGTEARGETAVPVSLRLPNTDKVCPGIEPASARLDAI